MSVLGAQPGARPGRGRGTTRASSPSHSWSTPDAYPRIYKLGGVVTPYAGDSEGFVEEWQAPCATRRSGRLLLRLRLRRRHERLRLPGRPARRRAPNPVTYPFTVLRRRGDVERQTSGERVFDINIDGVAHYGLYPDWIEDLRQLAGDADRRRHGARRRGLPADVGARRRRPGGHLRPLGGPQARPARLRGAPAPQPEARARRSRPPGSRSSASRCGAGAPRPATGARRATATTSRPCSPSATAWG